VTRFSIVACTCLLVATAAAASEGQRVELPRYGVSAFVPSGWHITYGRVNAVVDPVTLFTASTFPLHATRADRAGATGICSRPLQRAWRADGAYVQVAEERDGASRKRMLRRVGHRPRHFMLTAQGGGGLCTPPDSGQIAFRQGGRAFYVYYGLGRRASHATRAQAAAILDSLRIAARR
jgi:hypothetical protein